MNTTQNYNAGFAPIGAITAGLVALGLIGGGAVMYNHSKQAPQYQYGGAWNQTRQMQAPGMGYGRGQGGGMRAQGGGRGADFTPDYDTELARYQMGDISKQEKADLLYMREEEKLARDVYLTLYNKWGAQAFSNIAKSEERHALAIKALLDRYNITDPVIDDTVGVFQNQGLAKLYNDLVAQGLDSLEAALTVGATIEDLDIKDLQEAIARTDNEDIKAVYENLMRGSRNHLRSFYKELQALGADYKAQFITQAELEQIVTTPTERGGGHRQGGQGQGQGGMHSHQVQTQGMQQGYGQGQGQGGMMRGQGRMRGQGGMQGQGRGWQMRGQWQFQQQNTYNQGW